MISESSSQRRNVPDVLVLGGQILCDIIKKRNLTFHTHKVEPSNKGTLNNGFSIFEKNCGTWNYSGNPIKGSTSFSLELRNN